MTVLVADGEAIESDHRAAMTTITCNQTVAM